MSRQMNLTKGFKMGIHEYKVVKEMSRQENDFQIGILDPKDTPNTIPGKAKKSEDC